MDDDENRASESYGSSTSINIPTKKEAGGESVGYHVSSLSRRGPLWPQSFGSQMDNKIYSSSPKSRCGSGIIDTLSAGSNDYGNFDSIRGGVARDGIDSDLTEPLLRKDGGENCPSPKSSRRHSEDLEASRRINANLLSTRSSGSFRPTAGLGDQAVGGDYGHEEDAVPSGSSFLQAALNGVNVLAGMMPSSSLIQTSHCQSLLELSTVTGLLQP